MLERWELMANSVLEISAILSDYSADIQEAIKEDARRIAKEGVNELKATSPKRKNSGKYAKGWRVKTQEGRWSINCTVYNATDWQLTHLLEKGHRMVNRKGEVKGFVDAKVHIAPVEQKCIKQFQSDIERIIKNGG